MERISAKQIREKYEYFYNASEEVRQKEIKAIVTSQPDLMLFATILHSAALMVKKEGKKFQYTRYEVDFSVRVLSFVVFAMLPKDRKIPKIETETVKLYTEKADAFINEYFDKSKEDEESQTLLEEYPQRDMLEYALGSVASDEGLGEQFKDTFVKTAVMLISWIDGEID